jgi:hypothetical protein
MDRRYFFFKQRVTDNEMRAAFDGPESGLKNFATDLGVFGISAGGDVVEHTPNNMTVDISGPLRGYDQAGQRVVATTPQVLNVALDYLGNPTVPLSVGEARWISVHARFDRVLSDPRVDGNGDTQFWVQDESFELRVVSGVAAASPGHVKPAVPGDALLVCDIELVYGQTLVVNADIDETRKNVLVLFTASTGSVVSAGWVNLDNTALTIQDALDSADDELISRGATGDIEQTLTPDGATRDLGTAAKEWGEVHAVDVHVSNNILAVDGDETIGASGSRFDAHLDDLGVYGGIYVGAGSPPIGASGSRFLAAFIETLTAYTKIAAGSNGIDLGDATNRFDALLNIATMYNTTIAGALQMSAAKTHTVVMPIGGAFWDTNAPVQWDWRGQSGSFDGWRGLNGSAALYLPLTLPHGATLTGVEIDRRETTTTTGTAQLFEKAWGNVWTAKGSATAISSSAGWVVDAINVTAPLAIDREANEYLIKVVPSVANDSWVRGLRATFDLTDLGKAIIAA